MFSFIINHFDGSVPKPHLSASTLFAASLAKASPAVDEVIVVDGSAAANPCLQERCAELGARYLHAGRQLTFAEGYNAGAAVATASWLVFCASDVYVNNRTLDSIARATTTLPAERIGCLVPTLSYSALEMQRSTEASGRISIVPLTTINCNVFEAGFFREIGGIPEVYSGNYNDVEIAIRIVERGRHIYQVDDPAVHYGSLTLAAGGSNARQDRDRETFHRQRPAYFSSAYAWNVDYRPLLSHPLARAINRLINLIPIDPIRRPLNNRFARLLPRIQTVSP